MTESRHMMRQSAGHAAARRRPWVMGIVNVTPDSFSDGGHFLDPERAVDQAWALTEAGADIIDFGAESTRPGALPLTADEEWQRLQPVLTRLARTPVNARISIDTLHPSTMLRAVDAGAQVINSVGGLPPEDTLAQLARSTDLMLVVMHLHGTPLTMQKAPLDSGAAVAAVDQFFATAAATLDAAGFANGRCWFDPGIGFGKTDQSTGALLARVGFWSASGYQLAVGISRKGFLGRAFGITEPADRDPVTKGLEIGLALAGADLIRTHAVAPLIRALTRLYPAPLGPHPAASRLERATVSAPGRAAEVER